MSTRLKSTIVSAFKMHGFALRSNAIDYAVEIFAPLESSKIEECLDRLIAQVIERQKSLLTVPFSIL